MFWNLNNLPDTIKYIVICVGYIDRLNNKTVK